MRSLDETVGKYQKIVVYVWPVAYRPQKSTDPSLISSGFTVWGSDEFNCTFRILQGSSGEI